MADNRKIIKDLVLNSDGHPTADDIYQKLRSEGRKMTLATVYNNLNSLSRDGEIRCVSFNEKTQHYDKPTRHDHLICRNCGRVMDVHLEDLTEKFEAECGVTLDSYDLKLIYICPDCQKRAHAGAS